MMKIKETLKKSYRAVNGAAEDFASWKKGRIANNFANREYMKLVENSRVPPVTRVVDKRIEDYSRSVFKSPHFTGWLRFYAAFRGEFLEGWIPNNFFASFALPQINHAYRVIGGSGTLARRVIGGSNLPDMAYRIGREWFDTDWRPIPTEELSKRLFKDSEKAVLKCETSFQGRGVMVCSREAFEPDLMPGTNVVVQQFIKPAKVFSEISPGGFMTLRITTRSRGGRSEFAASHFRVVRKGEYFVQPSRLLLSVDRAGMLSADAWDNDWRKFSRHPDLGTPFEGFVVPGFDRAVELALDFHRRVPQFGVIGWDFLVPESGDPVLIEWNTDNPGMKFHEASAGPCLVPLELERLVAAGHTY